MMTRSAALAGILLILAGLAIFLWKTVVLDLPVVPTRTEGPWRVELEITARGAGRRGSVRADLPSSGPGQVIFDETSASDRLDFSIRTDRGQRTGVWSGRFRGVHTIVYAFRADLSAVEVPLPEPPFAPPGAEDRAELRSTVDFPADHPEVAALIRELDLPADPTARVRRLLAFCTDEVGTVATGAEDPLLTLSTREGAPEGKVRLLVALLRAAGVPARPVVGLRVREGEPSREAWVQARLGGTWVPMSPVDGRLGQKPADVLRLHTGSLALLDVTGAEATTWRFRALREYLRPEELAAMMVPAQPVFAELSLYRLPVATQAALRGLLLLPLGALITALYRNLIGIPTFGTFMPVLLALAMRYSNLGPGLAMVAGVLTIGIVGRLGLDRLRLLLVPRLSVMLCMVVLSVTAFTLFGRGFGTRDMFAAVLFPMVILTTLIERFSINMAEEGVRSALVKAGWSTLIAVSVYPVFRSSLAEHVMFGFPELVIVVMGLLVILGGYTGYRVLDLIRFRSLARTAEEPLP